LIFVADEKSQLKKLAKIKI
jgi:hypothetical protein